MKQYPHNIKKVYGPYTRKDTRQVVIIHLDDGTKKTKSYARYLKEIELGRELDPDEETVDHKDRNHHNDNNDNLQLLSRSENAAKSALRREPVIDNCAWCNIKFELTVNQIKNRKKQKAGPFCTKRCAGKYGSAVQNGKVDKFDPYTANVTYYRNDD